MNQLTENLIPNEELESQDIAQIGMAMRRLDKEVVSSIPAS